MSSATDEGMPGGEELAEFILHRVDQMVRQAEGAARPLEVDPYRAQLFELFVTAEGAGLVREEVTPDLTADGLCRRLADRWGLRAATEESVRSQAKIPPEQLARMRSLWSVMRMWMEWTYAWERWPEFHQPPGPAAR